MNRHVGNNTKLLERLDSKLTMLVERKTVETKESKASPNIYQGSSSHHASAAVYDADTPTAPLPPRQVSSKRLATDPKTLDEVKKTLDMCVDLTLSDEDVPYLKKGPVEGPDVDNGAAKEASIKPNKIANKTRKKRIVSRGKDLLKGLDVQFDVSDSDSDDCIIIESSTQSKLMTPGVNVSTSKQFPIEDNTQVIKFALVLHLYRHHAIQCVFTLSSFHL